jgi:hypothetical protein
MLIGTSSGTVFVTSSGAKPTAVSIAESAIQSVQTVALVRTTPTVTHAHQMHSQKAADVAFVMRAGVRLIAASGSGRVTALV